MPRIEQGTVGGIQKKTVDVIARRLGVPLSRSRCRLFYVCPRTGLLRAIEDRKPARATPAVTRITVNSTREYRLLDGIWYEVALQPLATADGARRDAVLDKRVRDFAVGEARQTYGAAVCAISRRQLGKRALRRLGLRNP